MPRSKTKTKPRKVIRDWRIIPDSLLLARNIRGSVFDPAESLRPNENTMLRYVDKDERGHAEAVEIIHSYKLLAPVIELAELP
jgi:hypothetical protein